MAEVSTARDVFIIGLRNAHAMENQALSIMRPQVARLEHYPDVAARLKEHIAETEGQLSRLDKLLGDAGSSASALKDTVLSALGSMAALGHLPAKDEILKNAMANHAFENYEIAAYTSLIAAARSCGDTAAVPVLEENLHEEERMAAWIREHLPSVTDAYIALRARNEKASA